MIRATLAGANARASANLAAAGVVATPAEVIQARRDLWGEAALKQLGGPSYEFFERLLPPLRYVDADFHHYPIVLSAPGAAVKGRLLSNGSQINALARQPNWVNEAGIPIHLFIGQRRQPFGADLARLTGPRLEGGWLPIVSLEYEADGERYGLRAFASVAPKTAASGGLFVRLFFPAANAGKIELRLESGHEYLEDQGGWVRDSVGRILLAHDANWEFNKARSALLSLEQHPASADIIVFTEPLAGGLAAANRFSLLTDEPEAQPSAEKQRAAEPALDAAFCERQEHEARETWERLLGRGMQVTVSEPIVNHAWRALLVQQHGILRGAQMNYSAGNQYARQYANESGDSIRSLTLWGHADTARGALRPLFIYRRPNIELHDAGFKLEDLADYYFVTRDRKLLEEMRPLWQREIDLILSSRGPATGLLPREKYCSDIETPVISLNNNANCWRGVRDMGLVLEEIGEQEQARKLAAVCAGYRKTILAAMEKWTDRTVDLSFIPVALEGEESVHDPITATRLGSYWNLVIPCVLWSGLFPPDSPPATAILRTIQEKGGLCMGLTRVQSRRGVWTNVQNIDDLYVIRYALALLWRDEPDRALVTFYGKLAQGFTRDTFMDGESTGIQPLDAFGRQVALPPNSTANASFLLQLRYLLVQDWDLDGDGRAETLRLLFATPRRWLEQGRRIVVQRAPTAFGEVSVQVESNVRYGKVTAVVEMPTRARPSRTLLRLRLPEEYRLVRAQAGARELSLQSETIDLTGLTGRITVVAQVKGQ